MRKLLKSSAFLALLVALPVLPATPASALDVANTFTADALPTWQTNSATSTDTTSGTVWALTSAQGKVFAGGKFVSLSKGSSTLSRTNLAVLDAATGVPTDCTLDVTGGTAPMVRALTASPDGSTVYVGGLFGAINGTNRRNIAAVDVATCTVTPFNPGASSFVYSIAATDSTVYYGGNFSSVGTASAPVTRSDLAAASTSGALLPWAPVADDDIFALFVDPNNGNVVVGGRMNTVNGQDSHALAVVNGTTGANVRNYPQPFIPYSPGTGQRQGSTVIKTITGDAGGFYIGAEGTGFQLFDGSAAFDWGSYNQRWRDTCLGATQALVTYQDVLYKGNHMHDCLTENGFEDGIRHHLNAETTADKQLLPWWPNTNGGTGEALGPRAMTVAQTPSGAYLWVGGEFTTVNTVGQRGLTRFGTGPDTGGPDGPQTPIIDSTVPGQAQITWRATQDNDDRDLTYSLYRGSSTTPIAEATQQASSLFWSRPQLTYVDKNLTPGSTYTYRVRVSDGTNLSSYSLPGSVTIASAASAYPNQVKADGASYYFRMQEPSGSAAGNFGASQDRSGSYYNSFTRGTAGALLDNPTDAAVTFDGSASSAFLRTDQKIAAPNTYSQELWFKTSTTSGGKLIGFGNKAANNGAAGTKPLSGTYDRHVYMRNDGKLSFGTYKSGTYSTITSPAAYNNNAWHHLVTTQGPGGMALFVDGVRVARNGVTSAQDMEGFWRVGGDAVGSTWPSPPTSPYFAGAIDEAAVYPTALTTTQIRQHYQLSGRTPTGTAAPTDNYGKSVHADSPELYWRLGEASGSTAVDASGNGENGTYSATGVTRNVASPVTGVANTAITTNGTTGQVYDATANPAPTTFSSELWFKTATTTGGKLIGWGNNATTNSTSYDKHIYLGNDGKLRFGVWYAGVYTTLVSTKAYNNNVWHHVVGTQDGSGTKLYVDGAVVASSPVTTNQQITGYWKVGGDALSATWPAAPTSKFVNASIDEVAVYTRALTPVQISTHYAIGTGSTPPDGQAPTAPGQPTTAVAGPAVNLDWAASTDNTAVTTYVVHRSATAGFTPATGTVIGQTNGATTYADPNPGPGTWYYAVVAFDAVGNASAASQQGSATLADTAPPATPTGLTAVTNGGSAQLNWTAPSDNVGVTRYEVYRSTVAGFTPAAANKVADTVAANATNAPGSDGTYYYKVVAFDAAGNASAPSNQASAVITSQDTTPPTAPTGLTGTRTNADVTLAWTGSTDNRDVDHYDVHRSTTAGFTPVAATKIGEATSTGYVDAGLTGGRYSYRVIAVDAADNSSALSNQATVTVDLAPPSAPADLTATAGSSGIDLGWSAATDDVGVDHYAIYRSSTSGFTPSASTFVADITSTSYTDTGATGTVYYRVIALDGGDNAGPASNQATATLADTTAPSRPTGLDATVTGGDVELGWAASTDNIAVTGYAVHRSTTTGFTPTAANRLTTVTGTSYTDAGRPLGTSYYKVVALDAAGNTSDPSAQATATVADSTAPTRPSGLDASVSGGTINLSWEPSTDDVGVTAYQVHRSTTSGFTPSGSTKVSEVSGTTYADAGRPQGTHHYTVVAVDAAGNTSPASAQASATITSAPVLQTVTVVPVEDTYANKGASNTSYGASTTMASRGATSPYTAYLKFTVPDAPAGATLVGASLKARTTSEAIASSTDTHQVKTTTNAWSETGSTPLTWNNQPTLGSTLGGFPAGSAVNAPIEATLSAADLAAAPGTTISLAVTSTGSDNLWFWSRSHANSSYRPALVLTYQIG